MRQSGASPFFIASELSGALLLFSGVLFVHSAPSIKSRTEGGVHIEKPHKTLEDLESTYVIQ